MYSGFHYLLLRARIDQFVWKNNIVFTKNVVLLINMTPQSAIYKNRRDPDFFSSSIFPSFL